jgi:hypothetical protein
MMMNSLFTNSNILLQNINILQDTIGTSDESVDIILETVSMALNSMDDQQEFDKSLNVIKPLIYTINPFIKILSDKYNNVHITKDTARILINIADAFIEIISILCDSLNELTESTDEISETFANKYNIMNGLVGQLNTSVVSLKELIKVINNSLSIDRSDQEYHIDEN